MRASASFLELPAPAKLNLFLRITGRREDGYHLLQTVFQLLDWGDTVRLRLRDDNKLERLTAIPGVTAKDDLSMRAAAALQAMARERGRSYAGADIGLIKAIPQGSGLGGASTDAATVLLGLNALWGCGFSLPELATLGLGLGADVPVFVRGHSAWAEGVGEQLTLIRLGERWYLLLFPGEGVSTAELFADPDLCRSATPLDVVQTNDYSGLGNAFLPVLKQRSALITSAFDRLSEWGEPRLTGSGSTLFLEVADKKAANRLTTRLKKHYNVRAVRGTDVSIVTETLALHGIEN